MVYHIITKEKWNLNKSKVYYSPNSLNRDGYIHCSYENQILKVANTFYKGKSNLIILCINEKQLSDIFKSEDLFNLNEEYPHIYGELPIKCIEKVVELKIDNKGDFILPNISSISDLLVKHKEWT